MFSPLWFYQKSLADPLHNVSKITCKTVFSKLTQQIYLSVSGEQASRQANTWPLAFLSQILDTFQPFRLLF